MGEQQQQQQALSNYSSSSNNNTNNQAVDAHNNNNNKVNNGCATYSASSDNSSQISANSDNDSSYSANSSSNNNNQSTHNEDEAQTDAMSFFNETLDLSHEDIQRTLIANMPYNNSNAGGAATTTAAGVAVATSAVAAATVVVAATTVSQEERPQESTDEDTADVFANLDAFDMLVEFPELDLDDKQALSNTALEQEQAHHAAAATAHQQPQRKLHQICDFSPEWSYTEGGVKVLVAGPWTSDGGCYTVLFDAQPVPTVLVQEGVLRCYCPAHEAGVVTLQVACGGFLVSNSAMFEYKLSLLADAPFDASSSNDCLYKFTLLNRLSTIDEKLQLKVENELAVSVKEGTIMEALSNPLSRSLFSPADRSDLALFGAEL